MASPIPREQASEPRPTIVCFGDSITEGGLGADWVDGLRERLGEAADVVNAGVGGQVTWDLRQRLDAVAREEPVAVILLVGSNDAVGCLGGSWASFYKRGRPQAPSEAWFAEQYDALLAEIAPLTANLLCLTLPQLGEDPDAPPATIVRSLNKAIYDIASKHRVDLLDLHSAILELPVDGTAGPAPFMSGLTQFMTRAMATNFRRRVLGQSWDAIGESRGLALTVDTIHPNDRVAQVMLDLVEPWARRALSGAPS